VEYAKLMEGGQRWERLHGAYYSMATLPCASWEEKVGAPLKPHTFRRPIARRVTPCRLSHAQIKGTVADERLLAFSGASGYYDLAYNSLRSDPQRPPADAVALRTARLWADALATIDGDFVAADQVRVVSRLARDNSRLTCRVVSVRVVRRWRGTRCRRPWTTRQAWTWTRRRATAGCWL